MCFIHSNQLTVLTAGSSVSFDRYNYYSPGVPSCHESLYYNQRYKVSYATTGFSAQPFQRNQNKKRPITWNLYEVVFSSFTLNDLREVVVKDDVKVVFIFEVLSYLVSAGSLCNHGPRKLQQSPFLSQSNWIVGFNKTRPSPPE